MSNINVAASVWKKRQQFFKSLILKYFCLLENKKLFLKNIYIECSLSIVESALTNFGIKNRITDLSVLRKLENNSLKILLNVTNILKFPMLSASVWQKDYSC